MTEAAVFGARGYLGRTLVALLVDHPHVEAVHPVSSTAAGRPYADEVPSMEHPDLSTLKAPGHDTVAGADVAFLATGADAASTALDALGENGAGPPLVVDLSRAHRDAALAGDGWTYGLPTFGSVAKGETRVANPGCYPTAALLAIGPALEAGLVGEGPLVVDGKSGVSGAGATPRADLHFPETNESLRAYNVDHHDHTAEIQKAAATLASGAPEGGWPVRFVPHLVPQNRGLLATVYAPTIGDPTPGALEHAYENTYAGDPTVHLADEPDTGHVAGSNHAHVAATLDADAGLVVARCAIDNLVKGGAGTAVQNMNTALGFDANAGLPWAGVTP